MSSDFSINYYKDNSAYQILRGLDRANLQYEWQKTDDTSIIDLAQKKADKTENKSAITIALEDFTSTTTGFNGSNSSNIDSDDAKLNLFDKIASFFGFKNDNIFKSEEGQELVSSHGKIYQKDIFNNETAKNNGIEYAKQGDDLYESALNFAKADIGAIEKAFQMAKGESNKNGKLDSGEINSYTKFDGNLLDAIKEIDLAGNEKEITAEEYASYIVAVDSLGNSDGKIDSQEAENAKDMKYDKLVALAKEVYEQYNN